MNAKLEIHSEHNSRILNKDWPIPCSCQLRLLTSPRSLPSGCGPLCASPFLIVGLGGHCAAQLCLQPIFGPPNGQQNQKCQGWKFPGQWIHIIYILFKEFHIYSNWPTYLTRRQTLIKMSKITLLT